MVQTPSGAVPGELQPVGKPTQDQFRKANMTLKSFFPFIPLSYYILLYIITLLLLCEINVLPYSGIFCNSVFSDGYIFRSLSLAVLPLMGLVAVLRGLYIP